MALLKYLVPLIFGFVSPVYADAPACGRALLLSENETAELIYERLSKAHELVSVESGPMPAHLLPAIRAYLKSEISWQDFDVAIDKLNDREYAGLLRLMMRSTTSKEIFELDQTGQAGIRSSYLYVTVLRNGLKRRHEEIREVYEAMLNDTNQLTYFDNLTVLSLAEVIQRQHNVKPLILAFAAAAAKLKLDPQYKNQYTEAVAAAIRLLYSKRLFVRDAERMIYELGRETEYNEWSVAQVFLRKMGASDLAKRLDVYDPTLQTPAGKDVVYQDYVYAGWLVIGRLKSTLENLAAKHNLSINIESSVGLTGRSMRYEIRGIAENVKSFQEELKYLAEAR